MSTMALCGFPDVLPALGRAVQWENFWRELGEEQKSLGTSEKYAGCQRMLQAVPAFYIIRPRYGRRGSLG